MGILNIKLKQGVFIFSILYVLINAFCIYKGIVYFSLFPIALLVLYLLFFKFEAYMFFLIALLPISVPLSSVIKGLPFDISLPAELLIVIATITFFYKVFLEGTFNKRILLHPVSIAIYLNIAWMLVTSITSTMPLVSFKFTASRIWFVTTFYFILLLIFIYYKRFYTYLWCYSLPFVLVILYFISVLISKGIGNIVATANQATRPFFPDHTSYAAAIAMLLPVMSFIVFIKRKAGFMQKFFFLGITIFFFIALILSYTRAAWLSLILAIGIMFLTRLKIKLHLTLIIGVVLGLAFYLSWTQIQISLSSNRQDSNDNLLKHVESASNVTTDASNLERLNRWHSAIRMFQEKPLLGFGPGTYMFQYAPYQTTSDRTIISTNAGNLGNAHSEYLGPLSESGMLGALSVLGIVLTSLFTASRVFFIASRRKVRLLALALMTGLLSYCIHGIMNDFLDLDKLNGLFWGFIAMIVALDIFHSHNSRIRDSIFKY